MAAVCRVCKSVEVRVWFVCNSATFLCCSLVFFFQAEDGIRDVAVTGVQTCALPIFYVVGRLTLALGRHSIRSILLPLLQRMAMNHGMLRREFLGALSAFSLFPLEQEQPDLILFNGNILTVNDREPRAEAVAVRRDRFLAVGSNSDVLNLATAATSKIDLGGKTVTPGFIDAHSHPAEAGLMHLRMDKKIGRAHV